MLIFFLFHHENICCGYSLEAPRRGASNEYPQHMFSWRNKKKSMWIPPLICSYVWNQVFFTSQTTTDLLCHRVHSFCHFSYSHACLSMCALNFKLSFSSLLFLNFNFYSCLYFVSITSGWIRITKHHFVVAPDQRSKS